MEAFSTHNDKLQVAWDASSLKSLQFCPRYYQYSNLEGWQAESVDLEFGRLIASGFEMYQKLRLDGKSKDEAVLAVVRWALTETYYPGTGHVDFDEDSNEHWHQDTPDTQWGGRYETMWKCDGTQPYKNAKGNRAKCPMALEKVWFPGDPPDICTTCRAGIRVERLYITEHQKNRQSLLRALIWYADNQPENIDDGYRPYVFPDGTKAVELSGRIPLPYKNSYGEDYILTWNFDYIGQYGSELFITDNKTTKKGLNSQFFDAYSPDTQFDTYDMVGSIAYPGLNIRGVMVDAVQVLVSGVEFGLHPYYKSEGQREEHLRDIGIWLAQAEMYALQGYWPMNKRNCWLCPFKQTCSLDPSQRAAHLAANFPKRPEGPWNPLHVR